METASRERGVVPELLVNLLLALALLARAGAVCDADRETLRAHLSLLDVGADGLAST